MAALHAVDAGLEGSHASDGPLSRLDAAGRVVDEADDVHEGRRTRRRPPGRATAGSFLFLSNREAPESARADATRSIDEARRRRGAAHHRREGRRLELRGQQGRPLARVSQRQERRGAAVSAPASRQCAESDTAARPSRSRNIRTGVGTWRWAPDSKRIYFLSANTPMPTRSCGARRSSRSTSATPRRRSSGLWALDLDPLEDHAADHRRAVQRHGLHDLPTTASGSAFRGGSSDRYKRNITQEGLYADLYLLETASGQIERLTNNEEVGESVGELLARQPHGSPSRRRTI